MYHLIYYLCFFFNDTATTEIYTLSLHDALPIFLDPGAVGDPLVGRVDHLLEVRVREHALGHVDAEDRKSTRLNSSHANISYAVFCLKKKNKRILPTSSLLLTNSSILLPPAAPCP